MRGPVLALIVAACGCGAPKPAPAVVRASEIRQRPISLAPGQPLILELEPGDEIPLEVRIEGPLVESPRPAVPIPLRVVRHFFLRIDGRSITTSLDGKTFGSAAAPGMFGFGIGATQERGLTATMVVRTPTPR